MHEDLPETVWLVYTIDDSGNPRYLNAGSERIARIVQWGLRRYGYVAECLIGTKREGTNA